ncbi:MAG TPA: thioredoxin family protein [Acidobacteriaceae bacterium]|nr:thioredoxin family protein [Acidobacteriaceae bacterium]
MITSRIDRPKVVSRDEWLAARKELLIKEKQLTRQRDEIDRQRRELPWIKVEKHYTFEGPRGEQNLADLFEGRSQLIVSHFMLGPGWKEGCVGCSFRSDHVDGALVHLEHHDVSLVTVSRAPLAEIEAFKKRMGWRFRWVSSYGSDFNYDYQVSFKNEEIETGRVTYNYDLRDFVSEELSGLSVFFKNAEGEIFHTYSTYGRGDEMVDTTYMYLDLTPKGRNENGPHYNLGDWVRHHDRYGAAGFVDPGGRFVAGEHSEPECGCSHDG